MEMNKCQHKLCDREAVGETLKQVNSIGETTRMLADISTCTEHWLVLHETWGLAQLQRLFEFTPRVYDE